MKSSFCDCFDNYTIVRSCSYFISRQNRARTECLVALQEANKRKNSFVKPGRSYGKQIRCHQTRCPAEESMI
jgi:hypothetical protein